MKQVFYLKDKAKQNILLNFYPITNVRTCLKTYLALFLTRYPIYSHLPRMRSPLVHQESDRLREVVAYGNKNMHEKLLDSDWLRAVQFTSWTPVQKV